MASNCAPINFILFNLKLIKITTFHFALKPLLLLYFQYFQAQKNIFLTFTHYFFRCGLGNFVMTFYDAFACYFVVNPLILYNWLGSYYFQFLIALQGI